MAPTAEGLTIRAKSAVHWPAKFIVLITALSACVLLSHIQTAKGQGNDFRGKDAEVYTSPLPPNRDRWVRTLLLQLLSQLPPLSALSGDGVRVVVAPWLVRDRYAVALWGPTPQNKSATSIIYVLRAPESPEDISAPELIRTAQFEIPEPVYRSFLQQMETIRLDWPRLSAECMDGTGIAFEWVEGSKVTSAAGNCGKPEDDLRLLLLNTLRPHAPAGLLPNDPDWY